MRGSVKVPLISNPEVFVMRLLLIATLLVVFLVVALQD